MLKLLRLTKLTAFSALASRYQAEHFDVTHFQHPRQKRFLKREKQCFIHSIHLSKAHTHQLKVNLFCHNIVIMQQCHDIIEISNWISEHILVDVFRINEHHTQVRRLEVLHQFADVQAWVKCLRTTDNIMRSTSIPNGISRFRQRHEGHQRVFFASWRAEKVRRYNNLRQRVGRNNKQYGEFLVLLGEA